VRLREFLQGLKSSGRRAVVQDSILHATGSTRVPERMAAQFVDLAADWFGGDAWAVLAMDEGRGLRWLAEKNVAGRHRGLVADMADRVVAGGQPLWRAPTAREAGRRAAMSTPALFGLPLRSHGRVVGVLVAVEEKPAADAPAVDLGHDRLAPIFALTDAVAGSLDVALRLKRANALSSVDDLTGLFNSRYLSGALRREVKRAVRTGRPLSLLFVDLDGFKGINDRYGHLCGSRALVEAAGRIQSGARETDVVARFGGDEFALILPDTAREGALLVAQRVRERVASQPFLEGEGIGYRLTASVGAATLPDVAETPEALLAAADTAMYRVKGRGKDGIESAEGLAPVAPGSTR
jgi:diguanylate cyclase (GGDEF)-like protein